MAGQETENSDRKVWSLSRIYSLEETGYSGINVKDGHIHALYEQGWEKRNRQTGKNPLLTY